MSGVSADLGGQAARGAAVTLAGQIIRTGAQIVGLILLARLLSPTDFGLIAMVVAVIGIGEVLRDLGLSTAAVQAKTLSRAQRDNLFWLNSGIGLTLTLMCAGAAFLIARGYGDERLLPITLVLSSTFLFNGLATQFKASVNRDMRFGRLAIIEVAPPVIALGVAIVMAFLGFGYWALVAQNVSQALLGLVLAVGFARWVPGRYSRSAPMRSLVRFGGNLAAIQVLTYLSKNVDSIIIGARFGPASLGLYDRAFQLVMVPITQMNAPSTRVALPVLSRLQDDDAEFERYLSRGQRVLLQPVLLVLVALFVFADLIIAVLLGPDWTDAALLMRLLVVAGFAQTASYALYWIFLAKGRTDMNLRYALVTRPFVIVALFVGSLFGVAGVASGYSLALLMMWPFGYFWARKLGGVDWKRLFGAGAIAALCYLPALAATSMALYGLQSLGWSPVADMALGLTIYFISVALSVILLPPMRSDWQLLGRQIRRLARKGGGRA